ncbi:MAG TPA: putative O-glycosylation ligase, exosortase A system-associated [Acetobacteraceae bacterium]|nr:putative O-glycosylation ligase, exosortase A system-associated [Acetobacteraceae bacterium]
MRSLLLFAEMMVLLPISIMHPFVGVLIFDWVSFMNPQQISWGFGSALPWALIAALFTITGWVLSPVEPKRIAVTPMTILMVLFVVGITINMPFAISNPVSEYDAWLRTTKIFLFLAITSSLLTSKHRIDALIWMIIISIGYYILDQGGASIVTLGGHKAFGPPKSQISDNNEFAAAVLVLIPMMNYLRMQSRYLLIRYGFALAIAMSILVVLASYSRGALLGLLAVAFVFWLKSKRKIVSLIALGCTLAAGVTFMPERWWDRMNTIAHYQTQGSAMSRLFSWHMGWELAKQHPFTGAGFHATTNRNVVEMFASGEHLKGMEIHGIWFQMLGEQGFIVFSIWLGMILVGLFECSRVIRLARNIPRLSWAADLARMGQVSILAYAVTGTFLPISSWDVFFTILVTVSAARLLVGRELTAAKSTPENLAWHPARAVGGMAQLSRGTVRAR